MTAGDEMKKKKIDFAERNYERKNSGARRFRKNPGLPNWKQTGNEINKRTRNDLN